MDTKEKHKKVPGKFWRLSEENSGYSKCRQSQFCLYVQWPLALKVKAPL